ncbi:branched-chain amino acid ABC transporter permease [Roseomonas stagni]|uniref:Branched-chain amino acid ABC transporter permease n=1 Tax=Falsiroseomonas algicola TaxID=2716930 RepID=A0A6M1LKI5_9PROT|nr:branched-chain amino acid ABC transporter permease [Falsiroseomonas algicola]NGM20811.1 branched-chain amino acid ABC transporter permease [Falsiroseomonas algicola]
MSAAAGVRGAHPLVVSAGVAVGCVAAIAGLAALPGGATLAQQVVSGLMLGGIYVAVAVAFTLTIGVLNFLNFTIPTMFMLTGMVAWGLARHGLPFTEAWHWALALPPGIVVAILASLVVERFTFRYLKTRHGDATEHAIPLVSSLGFLLIFEHLVLIVLGSDAQSFPVRFRLDWQVGPLVVGLPQLASLLLSLAIVFWLSWLLARTRTGRALRSIAESPDTATLLGVEVTRIVPVVFLLSGLLCGVAGALFVVNYSDVSPFMGDHVGTKAIAAMVLGGLGSIWGAIAGGLLVGLLETLGIHFFGGDAAQVVVWTVLLLAIVLRPQGLFGGSRIGKGKL